MGPVRRSASAERASPSECPRRASRLRERPVAFEDLVLAEVTEPAAEAQGVRRTCESSMSTLCRAALLLAFVPAVGSTEMGPSPRRQSELRSLPPEVFVAEMCRELVTVQHPPLEFALLVGNWS